MSSQLNTIPITIVGCGPGSPEFMTPAARAAIATAEVLVGAPRLLVTWTRQGVVAIAVSADIASALDRIADHLGKRIVVLVTGDPGVCSLAQPVLKRFGRAACRVIPGISSIQAAFAALGENWYDAKIISAHDGIPAFGLDALAQENKLAILAGNAKSASWLIELINRLVATHDVYCCENLTLPNERVERVEAMDASRFAALAVIVVIRKQTLS